MFDGLKVVLVVDDMFDYADRIGEKIRENAHVAYVAYDLRDVWKTISNIPGGLDSVDLIILDGQVSRDYTRRDGNSFRADGEQFPCTLEFIKDLREARYNGAIMANSSSPFNNDEMLKAGATHHGDTLRPWNAAQKILAGEA